jgi:hypothetical protein
LKTAFYGRKVLCCSKGATMSRKVSVASRKTSKRGRRQISL